MNNRQNINRYRCRSGFTLFEILIALMLFSVLTGVCAYIFTVSLQAWSSGSLRTGVREDISYAVERTVRDLKGAADGSLSQYSSIDHTVQFNDLSGSTYVFYLYNAADGTLDSTYSESTYDLLQADITGGDTPASGEGQVILRDLVSPDAAAPATALTISSNQVTLDFVVHRTDEIVRLRTKVRPRNL